MERQRDKENKDTVKLLINGNSVTLVRGYDWCLACGSQEICESGTFVFSPRSGGGLNVEGLDVDERWCNDCGSKEVSYAEPSDLTGEEKKEWGIELVKSSASPKLGR